MSRFWYRYGMDLFDGGHAEIFLFNASIHEYLFSYIYPDIGRMDRFVWLVDMDWFVSLIFQFHFFMLRELSCGLIFFNALIRWYLSSYFYRDIGQWCRILIFTSHYVTGVGILFWRRCCDRRQRRECFGSRARSGGASCALLASMSVVSQSQCSDCLCRFVFTGDIQFHYFSLLLNFVAAVITVADVGRGLY
jgi:hypothetical protein